VKKDRLAPLLLSGLSGAEPELGERPGGRKSENPRPGLANRIWQAYMGGTMVVSPGAIPPGLAAGGGATGAAVGTKTDEESQKVGGRLLVLVVERDPHIRELEAHFLELAGFDIEFTLDGQAALELARRISPDVIITEILVPKLDGLALCRQLKADQATAHISVLIFSILAASARAKEAGADAFLSKPLANHRLVDTVQTLLEKRRSERKEST
jgi:CheY-like chemotaxis protein